MRKSAEKATEEINRLIAAGTPELISLETLGDSMPGGKGGDALRIAAWTLKQRPGMRMDDLLVISCMETGLNSSHGGWVVSRDWGDYAGFGGLGLLWERRKERHAGDPRTVWHYYLLPAGETLATKDPYEERAAINERAAERFPIGSLHVTRSDANPGNSYESILTYTKVEGYQLDPALVGCSMSYNYVVNNNKHEKVCVVLGFASFSPVTCKYLHQGKMRNSWHSMPSAVTGEESRGSDDWRRVMRGSALKMILLLPDGTRTLLPLDSDSDD
jgi:hypothetical protein